MVVQVVLPLQVVQALSVRTLTKVNDSEMFDKAAVVSLLALAAPAGYFYNPLSYLFSPPVFGHTSSLSQADSGHNLS